MRKLLLACCLVLVAVIGRAQNGHQKIVFDLTSADTADYSRVLRQFSNILQLAPDAELEIVCHGGAVNLVLKEKADFLPQMLKLREKGKVSFAVCANSMKRMGVVKSQLQDFAEVVPMAMLELAKKQQEGWSYIWTGH